MTLICLLRVALIAQSGASNPVYPLVQQFGREGVVQRAEAYRVVTYLTPPFLDAPLLYGRYRLSGSAVEIPRELAVSVTGWPGRWYGPTQAVDFYPSLMIRTYGVGGSREIFLDTVHDRFSVGGGSSCQVFGAGLDGYREWIAKIEQCYRG